MIFCRTWDIPYDACGILRKEVAVCEGGTCGCLLCQINDLMGLSLSWSIAVPRVIVAKSIALHRGAAVYVFTSRWYVLD